MVHRNGDDDFHRHIKLILSFAGPWIQRVVPQAGLLGSLAGIGLALLGYLPIVEILACR